MCRKLLQQISIGIFTIFTMMNAFAYNQGYQIPDPVYNSQSPQGYQSYQNMQAPSVSRYNRTELNVVPVEVRQSRSTISLGGSVVPNKEVLLAAQVPGRIKFLAGTEGDFFSKGTVLAELDDTELQAQRQSAWASMRDAEAVLRNAGIQYNRELISPGSQSPSAMPGMGVPSLFDQFFTRPMGSMVGKGNPSLERYSDLHNQSTKVETSRNAYLRAKAELEKLDAKFRDSKSVAPFDGVIMSKLVEVGDTVQPGVPMVKFADTKALQISVNVPARLRPGLSEGMIVNVRLDVDDIHTNARVAQIFPMADEDRHTVRVKLDLPPGSKASPGMYVQVMIPDATSPKSTVLVIPRAAVIERGSLPMVKLALDKENKELRIVRLGEEVDAYHVSVLSGLKPGDFVVVEGGTSYPGENIPSWGTQGQQVPPPEYR